MTARPRKPAKPAPEVRRHGARGAPAPAAEALATEQAARPSALETEALAAGTLASEAPATGKGAADSAHSTADKAPALAARAPRDTLYYDGQCPLCRREISSLRAARGAAIALVDIHSLGDDTPVDRHELLRTLHLRRADGQWLRGADANVSAWDNTDKARWLALLRWPVARHVVDLGYRPWAAWRYRRLYGRSPHGEPRRP